MPPIHSKEKLEENKRYDITYLEYPLENRGGKYEMLYIHLYGYWWIKTLKIIFFAEKYI